MQLTDQIKSRVDIVDVVSQYVTLKKAGKNYKGLCPFHDERSPSFFVSPDKEIAYCFSCQGGGDVFKFIMQIEDCSFGEALQILAEKADIDLQSSDEYKSFSADRKEKINKEDKDEYLRWYQVASNYFRQNLYATEGTDALSYLHNRGVSDSMIEEFGLGYALDHFEDMRNYMLKQGFSDQNLSTIDLIKPKQGKVAEFFDSFRDRVMFPIQNNLGHTIAFGARTLSGADPKYLNSAEHPLYHKSDVIYNLHRAKTHIKKQDFTIVVEGYMDAIMMYQEGFHNVVATLGTAFTPKHLQKLKRLSNKIVFAFDSDNAGQAAIKEAGMMALAQDMDVYVLTLPGAKDPAELLLEENGKESLEQSIEAKKALIDYFIDTRRDFYDLTEVLDRKNYAIEIISLIQTSTNALVREAYIQKLSSITHLSGDNLMYILANIDKEKAAKQDRQVKKAASQKASNSVKLSVEDYLIGMLINTQKFIEQIPSDMQLSSPVKTKLLHDLLAVIQAGEFNSSQFINQQDNDRIKTYLGFVSLYIEDTLDEKSESWVKNEIDALLRKIQQKTTKNSTDLLKKQIQEKESRGEMDEEYFTLLKQLQDGLTR